MDTSSAAAIRRPQVRFKYILFVAFVLMFLFVLWTASALSLTIRIRCGGITFPCAGGFFRTGWPH